MPEQCYLIDGRLKFYFVPNDLHLEYKENRQDLTELEAKVLKFMFEHHQEGVIAIDEVLKAGWGHKGDRKALMQLLFEVGKKAKSLGFIEDGFVLNGPNYLITYHFVLIDGYRHQIEQIRQKRLAKRRYIAVAVLIFLAFMLVSG